MKRLKIIVDVTVTEDCETRELRQRVADQLRKLSNPVREDQGILTVNHVRITPETYPIVPVGEDGTIL